MFCELAFTSAESLTTAETGNLEDTVVEINQVQYFHVQKLIIWDALQFSCCIIHYIVFT
jgi:hypothetical protein